MSASDTPVLIIGAGPVGLTMAAFLHHHKVPCRIIDKRSEATQTSNAVAIHARTLELMKSIGLIAELQARGKKIQSIEVGSKKKTLINWQMNRVDSDYDFALCVPQSQTEKILIEHLKQSGITVERNLELIDISQDKTSCSAKLKNNITNEEITITTDWLVSCDGYHSAVRDRLSTVSYNGSDMQLRFIMIDAPVECDNKELLDKISVYNGPDCTLMLFPMQNSVRLAAEISRSHRFDHLDDEPDQNIFTEIAKDCLPYEITIGKPLWTSKFWIHERLASHYRINRIFLAGDAGHAHSPAGGQGMNTGMQDAINLAWKLALVYHTKAKENLLDSYEAERRPVAAQVISKAGKLTQVMTADNSFFTTVRDTVMPLITSFETIQNKVTNELAETSINYRKSPLNLGGKTAKTRAGDLCPLHALRSNDECVLIDFTGDAETNGVKVVKGDKDQAAALGLNEGGYCLVRPDGYIAYIGMQKPEINWLKSGN